MTHWLYLALLLIWAGVIGLQWLIGWRILWRKRFTLLWTVVGLSAYLSLADAVAIGQRIWFFRPTFLVGWYVGNVPGEEILFCVLTTALIVQGFVMLFPYPTSS